MKMADLKNLLVDKLLVLTNGKVSQGVKDYMNTEIIAKGVSSLARLWKNWIIILSR